MYKAEIEPQLQSESYATGTSLAIRAQGGCLGTKSRRKT